MKTRTNLNTLLVILVFLLGMVCTSAGQTIYVDVNATGSNDGTSWVDAYNYLQDALADANSSSKPVEIWVAKGIYRPSELTDPCDPRTATFQLINGVAIYGGFPSGGGSWGDREWAVHKTILSGDLAGNDDDPSGDNSENSYHVVTGSGTDETAVLDGFTITGGYAKDGAYRGGGIYCNQASPTISNCVIIGNHSSGFGGGMYNKNSSPTVTNCIFRDNTAVAWGGGMYNYHSSPKVTGCFFEKNKANFGGGMHNQESSPTVVNCVFSENYSGEAGGGMYNYYKPTAKLVNCIFSGNYANNAGGGMCNYLSPLTLVNCTFSGNSATNRGGAIVNDLWDQKLTNCVIWGNYAPTDPEITNNVSHPRIKCCDIRGCGGSGEGWDPSFGYDKGGNIDEDPCFVEPGYWADANDPNIPVEPTDPNAVWIDGDYHLPAVSPCIDAGDNTAVPPDTTDLDGDGNTTEPIPWDLDGNPRIVDGNDDGNSVVDMGAYEFSIPPIEVPMKFTPQALNPNSKGNWVKAHLVLPEGFTADDVDANTPARVIEPVEIESDYIDVFINEDGLVEIEIGFDRAAFCAGIDYGPAEVTVVGLLTSGQYFVGSDTIRIISGNLKYLAVFASHWLEAGCGAPDWCGGVDLDQNTIVDFVDFALFDGYCIEVVKE